MSWISDLNGIAPSGLHFKIYRPIPELSKVVAYYWVLKCSESAPREAEFMLPDGFEEVIFSFGGAYKRICATGKRNTQKLKTSYLIGAKDQAVICARYTTLNMVGIKLYPQTLATLGRYSANSIFNQTVDLYDFNSPSLCELEDKLFNAESESVLIKQLNSGMLALLGHLKTDATVSNSLKLISANRGNISIAQVAQSSFCHYRTLEKKFKCNVGMSPKQYARNMRFSTAFFDLSTKQKSFEFEDYGYYDNSHFSKEFTYFTGLTPQKFLASCPDTSTEVFEQSHRSARGFDSNAT